MLRKKPTEVPSSKPALCHSDPRNLQRGQTKTLAKPIACSKGIYTNRPLLETVSGNARRQISKASYA